MTRQQRWQQKKMEAGLCYICGKPAVAPGKYMCLEHMVKARERQRIRVGSKKRTNSLSYRLEKAL